MADFTGWGDYAAGGAFAPTGTGQMPVGQQPTTQMPIGVLGAPNPGTPNPNANVNTYGPGGAFGTVNTQTGLTMPNTNVQTGSPSSFNPLQNSHRFDSFQNFLRGAFQRPQWQQPQATQGYQTPTLQAYNPGMYGAAPKIAPLQARPSGPLTVDPYTR